MKNLLFGREPVLTENQYDRLANIFDNAGQVALGVAVLSPIIAGFDQINRLVVISGIVVVMFCWMLSLWLSNKGD